MAGLQHTQPASDRCPPPPCFCLLWSVLTHKPEQKAFTSQVSKDISSQRKSQFLQEPPGLHSRIPPELSDLTPAIHPARHLPASGPLHMLFLSALSQIPCTPSSLLHLSPSDTPCISFRYLLFVSHTRTEGKGDPQ